MIDQRVSAWYPDVGVSMAIGLLIARGYRVTRARVWLNDPLSDGLAWQEDVSTQSLDQNSLWHIGMKLATEVSSVVSPSNSCTSTITSLTSVSDIHLFNSIFTILLPFWHLSTTATVFGFIRWFFFCFLWCYSTFCTGIKGSLSWWRWRSFAWNWPENLSNDSSCRFTWFPHFLTYWWCFVFYVLFQKIM